MSTDSSTVQQSETDAPEQKKGTAPVYKPDPIGNISLAVWERISTTADGRQFMTHDYTLQRFFPDDKDPSGWGHSVNYRPRDTGDLQLASWKAHNWIRGEGKKRAAEFAQSHGTAEASDDGTPF